MTPRKHGPWTIKASTLKYQHKLIEIHEDQVTRPDGSAAVYATARVPAGVSVLAADDAGFVYLAREFRYAVGRETLETVGGAIDVDEQPADAARRELREELGIEADEFIALGRVDPMTSLIDSPAHLFLARRLQFKEQRHEGSERITLVKLALTEAVKLVYESGITHGASCTLIMRAHNFIQRETQRGDSV